MSCNGKCEIWQHKVTSVEACCALYRCGAAVLGASCVFLSLFWKKDRTRRCWCWIVTALHKTEQSVSVPCPHTPMFYCFVLVFLLMQYVCNKALHLSKTTDIYVIGVLKWWPICSRCLKHYKEGRFKRDFLILCCWFTPVDPIDSTGEFVCGTGLCMSVCVCVCTYATVANKLRIASRLRVVRIHLQLNGQWQHGRFVSSST